MTDLSEKSSSVVWNFTAQVEALNWNDNNFINTGVLYQSKRKVLDGSNYVRIVCGVPVLRYIS